MAASHHIHIMVVVSAEVSHDDVDADILWWFDDDLALRSDDNRVRCVLNRSQNYDEIMMFWQYDDDMIMLWWFHVDQMIKWS